MGDLPVGKAERLCAGEFFSVEWRHQRQIKFGIVSRKFGRMSRKYERGLMAGLKRKQNQLPVDLRPISMSGIVMAPSIPALN
jgi:hypothetical protein